ncbi:amidohydrolase [Bifidobacterium pullorum subsp. saeculare]|uniref:Amidohydrolase n=1 Tax=Bifidobacterium pullorum subsp. saeculare TaxID=78257 RepID=A0A939B960_9BIFI|nr:amidohydrolase [Bifidobacterium pullorum]MBM6698870.1 amidohydrolase [Bifidobacterium pullorum subsp. saeculare]
MLAITNAIIVTVDDCNAVIKDGTILIEGRSLAYVGPSDCVPCIPAGATLIDCAGKFVAMPGLIDTHNHSSLIRGVAENLNLVDWLPVYDLEHRTCTPQDARQAYRLGYMECLLNGTTTVQDMYRFMDQAAQVAGELGIRAFLAPYAADMPPYDFFESSEANEQLIKDWHGAFNGRIQVEAGIEDVFYAGETMYRRALDMHEQYGVRIHTHGPEHAEEETTARKRFGMSIIELLNNRRLLGDFLSLGHCVPISRHDMELIAAAGASICHCPVSAAKLGCGTAPVKDMEEVGINVSLGSDGPIDNNSMDLFQEMKVASLMQKVHYADAKAFDATHMLRMATINGARSLGIDGSVGSLEQGKLADVILISLNHPSLRPVCWNDNDSTTLIWALVFAMQGSFVDTVIVDGQLVVRHGHLVTADEQEIIDDAQRQGVDWMKRRNAAATHVLAPIRD